MTYLDAPSTALVLIDLQKGILAMQTEPHDAMDVFVTGRDLARQFRTAGAPVVLVNVAWADDFADMPTGLTDRPSQRPEGGLPAEWSELAEGLEEPGDLLITKHQWGAFTGTELDLQLRRRGIRTIVLAGIATNFGVESTARHAWELGYNVVIVEDGCTSSNAELHTMVIEHVFPRIARVTGAEEIKLV